MEIPWMIGPENAVSVAEYLLQLELTAIQPRYLLDLGSYVLPLKQALDNYRRDGQQVATSGCLRSYIEQLEEDLQYLINTVNHVMLLLTPEAKKELAANLSLALTNTHLGSAANIFTQIVLTS